jgi:hypothetical protein
MKMLMHVHTRQQRVDEVPARWERQYPPKVYMNRVDDKYEKGQKLKALTKPLNPDEVDRIIGNSSWTEFNCSQCDLPADRLIFIGEEPDYESSNVDLCETCLTKAMGMMK